MPPTCSSVVLIVCPHGKRGFSDRFLAIRITLASYTTKQLTIIGAYMPDTGHPIAEYRPCLEDLEHLLMSSLTLSPCIIGGDLNAHIGSLGGPRSIASPDIKSILWNDLLDTTSMYVPSLCETATGPTYTYSSGGHHMTIDYFLATI